MPAEETVLVEVVPPPLQLYDEAPEAVNVMEVVEQVIVPLEGETETVGGVVLLVITEEAVAVQPLAAVPVTV